MDKLELSILLLVGLRFERDSNLSVGGLVFLVSGNNVSEVVVLVVPTEITYMDTEDIQIRCIVFGELQNTYIQFTYIVFGDHQNTYIQIHF